MIRQPIRTNGAPAPVGPYSQAIVAGDLVFCSGQVGLDPATGDLVEGLEAQADRALRNLSAVLDAAGVSWADVVKTTIFLADVGDFAAVNAIYAKVHAGSAAGPLDGRRERPAEGRAGRGRSDRPPIRGRRRLRAADLSLTLPSGHTYDPAHLR